MLPFKKLMLDWKVANLNQPVESVPGISLWRKKQPCQYSKTSEENHAPLNQNLNSDTDKF